MSKALTVIFSSFNGEQTVAKTLEAFCEVISPVGGWKLISVDNGSTDRTAAIMQSFSQRLPLQILSVPTKGKNIALNAALAHVEGDLIVFTDDDVVPDPQWLCALQNCAHAHPDYGLFGGAIVPHWPHPPPTWILNNLDIGMLYAATLPTLSDGEVTNDLVWGGNMAVRRAIFDDGIRYDSSVGPDGTKHYMMGSEAELIRKLTNLGVKGWFCPSARVKHIIRADQLSKRWILQRYFRHGRSIYLIDQASRQPGNFIFNVDRWLYRELVITLLKAGYFLILGRRAAWFKALTANYHIRGQIFQSKQMHRNNI